jgi:hypothetical protein
MPYSKPFQKICRLWWVHFRKSIQRVDRRIWERIFQKEFETCKKVFPELQLCEISDFVKPNLGPVSAFYANTKRFEEGWDEGGSTGGRASRVNYVSYMKYQFKTVKNDITHNL